ncbi:MAG: hypothetical protein JW797_19630 [Bradymonadales bacterium]|nr:hypothetical protein [Bradymonadales bacterium]
MSSSDLDIARKLSHKLAVKTNLQVARARAAENKGYLRFAPSAQPVSAPIEPPPLEQWTEPEVPLPAVELEQLLSAVAPPLVPSLPPLPSIPFPPPLAEAEAPPSMPTEPGSLSPAMTEAELPPPPTAKEALAVPTGDRAEPSGAHHLPAMLEPAPAVGDEEPQRLPFFVPMEIASWEELIHWCVSNTIAEAGFAVDGEGFLLAAGGVVPPDGFEGTGATLCYSMDQLAQVDPTAGRLESIDLVFDRRTIFGLRIHNELGEEFILGLVSGSPLNNEAKHLVYQQIAYNLARL